MPFLLAVVLILGFYIPSACGGTVKLGPRDPGNFSPTDINRVVEGMEAPDFTLQSLAGPPVTLSQFRGKQNVILVFYRGFW